MVLQLYIRVIIGHVHADLLCDLTGLGGAGARLLPPGNISSAQVVQT